MKKILSPISRWQFFITLFTVTCLLGSINPAIIICAFFFRNDFILILLILELFIIIFAAFKRLIDIYGNIKKALITAFIFSSCWIFVLFKYVISQFNSFWNSSIGGMPEVQADTTVMKCYFIISALFFIFLVFTKGVNNRDKLNIKTVSKRILLTIIISIFSISITMLINLFDWTSLASIRMIPTIEFNDTLLAYKKFKYESLKRFDIVSVHDEVNNVFNEPLRIIGLPNEKVEIKNNKIYINNEILNDEYAFYGEKLMSINLNKTVVLDENSYFVMGDNRYYQTGGKYLAKNKKTGKENWINIRANEVGFKVSKDKIIAKIIAINYKKYSKSDIEQYGWIFEGSQKRDKTGIVILTKNKIPKHNPSQFSTNMFGKNIKNRF